MWQILLFVILAMSISCGTVESEINIEPRGFIYQSDALSMGFFGNIKYCHMIVEKGENDDLRKSEDVEFHFNEYGNLTTVKYLRPDLTILSERNYSYDSLNRKFEEWNKSSKNEFLVGNYNYIGNPLVVTKEYFLKPQSVSKDGDNIFTYDQNGNLLTFEVKPVDPRFASSVTTYSYDVNNRITSSKKIDSNKDSVVGNYQSGYLFESISYSNGTISVWEKYNFLEFDENQNWTKATKIISMNGIEMNYMIVRTIEYW